MQDLSLEVKINLHAGCLPDDTVQTANLLVRIYRLFFPSQLFSSHIFRSSCCCSILSHYIFHLTTRTILFFCEKRYHYYAINSTKSSQIPLKATVKVLIYTYFLTGVLVWLNQIYFLDTVRNFSPGIKLMFSPSSFTVFGIWLEKNIILAVAKGTKGPSNCPDAGAR